MSPPPATKRESPPATPQLFAIINSKVYGEGPLFGAPDPNDPQNGPAIYSLHRCPGGRCIKHVIWGSQRTNMNHIACQRLYHSYASCNHVPKVGGGGVEGRGGGGGVVEGGTAAAGRDTH